MRTSTVPNRAILLLVLVAFAIRRVASQPPGYAGIDTGGDYPPWASPSYTSGSDDDGDFNTDDGGSGSGLTPDEGNRNISSGIGATPTPPPPQTGSFHGPPGGGDPRDHGNGEGNNEFGEDAFNNTLRAAGFFTCRVAHGVLATLAFVFLFPLGAILLRSLPGRGAFHSHWILQVVASLLYIIAAALGLYMVAMVPTPSGAGVFDRAGGGSAHPVIGIVLLVAVILQPLFGMLHHRGFKRTDGGRTWASYVHLWNGRLAVTLGIINGGLGLVLAEVDGAPVVVYAVFSVLVWLAWLLVTLRRYVKIGRRGADAAADKEERAMIVNAGGEFATDSPTPPPPVSESAAARHRRSILPPPPPAAAPASGANEMAANEAVPPMSMARTMSMSTVVAEPSPPYTPGPDYHQHVARMRQQRGIPDTATAPAATKEEQEAEPGRDDVSFVAVSISEMRRGQV
ncbi:hypothetical protein F4808DRAFT_173147 [Astrocystis sublimbata]|nr:hypothetical protein F4808DRAFT_173147 [Astrocystis sublimbata]